MDKITSCMPLYISLHPCPKPQVDVGTAAAESLASVERTKQFPHSCTDNVHLTLCTHNSSATTSSNIGQVFKLSYSSITNYGEYSIWLLVKRVISGCEDIKDIGSRRVVGSNTQQLKGETRPIFTFFQESKVVLVIALLCIKVDIFTQWDRYVVSQPQPLDC